MVRDRRPLWTDHRLQGSASASVCGEEVSVTGANVLERGRNIDMNEALSECVLLKPVTSLEDRQGGV